MLDWRQAYVGYVYFMRSKFGVGIFNKLRKQSGVHVKTYKKKKMDNVKKKINVAIGNSENNVNGMMRWIETSILVVILTGTGYSENATMAVVQRYRYCKASDPGWSEDMLWCSCSC